MASALSTTWLRECRTGERRNNSTRQFYHATYNLLNEASGRAGRFVYISSVAACGLGRHLKGHTDSDTCRKSGIPYNDAKTDTENLVWKYQRENNLPCTIIRPANVIGPRSAWSGISSNTYQLKGTLPLIDGGKHSASLIYVDNLVDGIILAGTSGRGKGKTYQLRDDYDVTWRQYITDLGAALGKKPTGNIPFAVAWPLANIIEGLFMSHARSPRSHASAWPYRAGTLILTTAGPKKNWAGRQEYLYEEAMKIITIGSSTITCRCRGIQNEVNKRGTPAGIWTIDKSGEGAKIIV